MVKQEHADLEGVGRRPRPYPLFLNIFSKITKNMPLNTPPPPRHTHSKLKKYPSNPPPQKKKTSDKHYNELSKRN